MKEIFVEPMGNAILIHSANEIPKPCEFIAAFNGYWFYQTDMDYMLFLNNFMARLIIAIFTRLVDISMNF